MESNETKDIYESLLEVSDIIKSSYGNIFTVTGSLGLIELGLLDRVAGDLDIGVFGSQLAVEHIIRMLLSNHMDNPDEFRVQVPVEGEDLVEMKYGFDDEFVDLVIALNNNGWEFFNPLNMSLTESDDFNYSLQMLYKGRLLIFKKYGYPDLNLFIHPSYKWLTRKTLKIDGRKLDIIIDDPLVSLKWKSIILRDSLKLPVRSGNETSIGITSELKLAKYDKHMADLKEVMGNLLFNQGLLYENRN